VSRTDAGVTTRSLRYVPLAIAIAAVAIAAPDTRFDPHSFTAPPLRPLQVPTPDRTVLPNGTVVFLLEDHRLPVVSGTAYFPSSPSLIADGQVGIEELTGDAMRRGGTATHPGDVLDDRLAALGATISTSLDAELGYAGLRCQSEDVDEVVGLFADLLQHPAFPDRKLALAKLSLHQQVASRNDEILPIADRLARVAVHGEHSPWARIPEHATVDAVDTAACRDLWARVFVPERMVLAFYGDFRTADLKKRLTAAFAGWRPSGTPAPRFPAVADRVHPRLLFAQKDDVTQSVLLVTGPGLRVDAPDAAAMDVVEQALGRGGQSRLDRHIRAQRGLAYSTGAAAGEEYLRPGEFMAWSLTRNDSALTALGLLRQELRGISQAPLDSEEFLAAKQSVENQLVFNFEQRSAVLFRAAYYEVLGYPADFLARYQRSLAAVTRETAFAAARARIQPDEMGVVVVGNAKQFERTLQSVGLPVTKVDIRIPPGPKH
jgi:zinc protease